MCLTPRLCSLIDGPEVEHGAHFLILYYPTYSRLLATEDATRSPASSRCSFQLALGRDPAADRHVLLGLPHYPAYWCAPVDPPSRSSHSHAERLGGCRARARATCTRTGSGHPPSGSGRRSGRARWVRGGACHERASSLQRRTSCET